MTEVFTLHHYPEQLGIFRFGPGADVPPWAESASLFSVTATATETSIIAATRSAPAKVPTIGPLTAFMVEGPLDPSLVGVMHTLLGPLAEAGVSVFSHSTFDTDWILVPVEATEAAAEEWRRRGHAVVPAVPAEPAR